jgi:hypothetical protein
MRQGTDGRGAPKPKVGALLAHVGLWLVIAVSGNAQPAPAAALIRRALPADTVIAGVPCAKSGRAPAEFYIEGLRLAGCALSRPFVEAGHAFGAGTWLDRNAAGVLWGAWLAHDTPLGGHTCRGDGYKKWSTRFHPNGRLAGCYLARDTIIAGVPCMAGTFLREIRGGGRASLALAADGRPLRCQAARDTVRDGVMIRKWTLVRLSPT